MSIYLQKIIDIAIPNKYTTWYVAIINNALTRATTKVEANTILGYTEGHHILPKSFKLGGNKDKENLAFLTAREHFLVHLLASKMFTQPKYKRSMCFALASFMRNSPNGQRSKLKARQYEKCRQSIAAAMTGRAVSQETREKLSKNQKGKPNGRKGLPVGLTGPCSETRKNAISNARKLTGKVSCLYCRKETCPANHQKYHGDNCISSPNSESIKKQRSILAKASMAKSIAAGTHVRSKQTKGEFKCPYCPKIGTNNATMKRFHYERCILSPTGGSERKALPNSKVSCLACKQETDLANFSKWHGNKCKKSPD